MRYLLYFLWCLLVKIQKCVFSVLLIIYTYLRSIKKANIIQHIQTQPPINQEFGYFYISWSWIPTKLVGFVVPTENFTIYLQHYIFFRTFMLFLCIEFMKYSFRRYIRNNNEFFKQTYHWWNSSNNWVEYQNWDRINISFSSTNQIPIALTDKKFWN